MVETPDDRRWNNNIRYQRALLEQLPAHAQTALDVGCGEGMVARSLASRGLEVTAIDADAASIEQARSQATEGITYVTGDAFTTPLPRSTYDVVTAIAVLHHLDLRGGLTLLADLVAPGGSLRILGLAQTRWPQDLAQEALGVAVNAVDRIRRPHWDHGSPTVWPPPHTYSEVRGVSAEVLPGRRYERKLMYRYTLVWDRPASSA